jgi:hypothetical protein
MDVGGASRGRRRALAVVEALHADVGSRVTHIIDEGAIRPAVDGAADYTDAAREIAGTGWAAVRGDLTTAIPRGRQAVRPGVVADALRVRATGIAEAGAEVAEMSASELGAIRAPVDGTAGSAEVVVANVVEPAVAVDVASAIAVADAEWSCVVVRALVVGRARPAQAAVEVAELTREGTIGTTVVARRDAASLV